MKKVLGNMAIYIFSAFTVAVFGMLVSLTYQALQRIFPSSFENQIVGLVLFDIGAICWAVAFVFLCKSTAQYASAAVGFLAAFIGTLGMVAAEVILSGNLIETDPQQIGQWLVYGFIGVTALHVTMIYLYHGGAPDIKEKIDVGIARGEIVTEAIAQATKSLESEKAMLAQTITQEIVAQVKRDLNIPILADKQMPIIAEDKTIYQQETTIPHWTCLVCNEYNLLHTTQCIKCGEERGTIPAWKTVTAPNPQYAHLYPPNGDRQHPDRVFAKLPSKELALLNQAWIDYDNSRMANLTPVAPQEGATTKAPFHSPSE